MIGALISGLFNFLLGLVATVIQIVCFPLNAIIEGLLPDFASWISQVSAGITTLLNGLAWPLSLLPVSLLAVFGFCFGLRLIIQSISVSTHTLVKVWNIFQKIKFW